MLCRFFLARWDKEIAAHPASPFTGIAANDAHQNQIFNGTTFDPYAVAFRHVSTHILARDLTESNIRESLVAGRAYVSHDWLCDPTGFTFIAQNNLGLYEMGDRIPLSGLAVGKYHHPCNASDRCEVKADSRRRSGCGSERFQAHVLSERAGCVSLGSMAHR